MDDEFLTNTHDDNTVQETSGERPFIKQLNEKDIEKLIEEEKKQQYLSNRPPIKNT